MKKINAAISPEARVFLHSLLDTPGPSGFEGRSAKVWRAEASKFAEVTADLTGNSMAVVNSAGSPTIMLAGHIDEIGVIVTYIDDDGFAYIAPIGGWDPQVLIGQRMRFAGPVGDVLGAVGKLPMHVIRPDAREKAAKFRDLWVDIGATTKAEAERLLNVGDSGVIDSRTFELPNGRLVSRSIDNRIGAFAVLEALRRYSERPGTARVIAVATAQEEIGLGGGGALIAASALLPQMAIVVDVTFAVDHPSIEKKEYGEARLGGGPVLTRGSVVSPVVFNLLREAAERESIPFTVQAAGRTTGTDADAIHIAHEGVATGIVGIPNRYMHSPNEMVSLADVNHVANLVAETCRSVTSKTDFTAL